MQCSPTLFGLGAHSRASWVAAGTAVTRYKFPFNMIAAKTGSPVRNHALLVQSHTESMSRIDAQNFQRVRLRDEGELLERQFEPPVLRMTLHVGIELRGGEVA